jgi:hypothetical protein
LRVFCLAIGHLLSPINQVLMQLIKVVASTWLC